VSNDLLKGTGTSHTFSHHIGKNYNNETFSSFSVFSGNDFTGLGSMHGLRVSAGRRFFVGWTF